MCHLTFRLPLRTILAFGAFLPMLLSTQAAEVRSRDLVRQCEELQKVAMLQSADKATAGQCLGYLSAYLDISGWSVGDKSANLLLIDVCLPKAFDVTQLTKMFVDHVREKPETMDLGAPIVLANLLMAKFRCQKEH